MEDVEIIYWGTTPFTKVKTYIAQKIKQIYENNNLNCIIEIWPWKWAITKKIHDISDNFFVIEKDETMKDHLELILDKKQIIFTDILKSDIEKELKKRNIDSVSTLIIWNLPYYITSPIFRKFFGNWEQEFFGWFFRCRHRRTGYCRHGSTKIAKHGNSDHPWYWYLNRNYRWSCSIHVWAVLSAGQYR